MGLDEVLNPQEKLIYSTRLHWLPCAPGALALSLLAVAAVVALVLFAREPAAGLFAEQPLGAWVVTLVLGALVVVPLFVVRFLVSIHEYGVTDRRVIARMGWVNTRTVDLSVAKVETLIVEQGALGRLFGYGDVKVVGTGGTAEVFRGVCDPIGFRKAVNAASDGGPAEASA